MMDSIGELQKLVADLDLDDSSAESIEKLKELVEEAAKENLALTPPLVVNGLIEKYPDLFSEDVKTFFATGLAVKSTLLTLPRGDGDGEFCYPCEFFSAVAPIAKEREAVAALAQVLGELEAEDALVGYLCPPSNVHLANPVFGADGFVKGWNQEKQEWNEKEREYLPTIKECIFCFFFTTIPHSQLKERFPQWVCLEGEVGQPLELEL